MVTVYFALKCSFDGAVNRTVGNESVAIAGVFVAQKRISNAKEDLFSCCSLNNSRVKKSDVFKRWITTTTSTDGVSSSVATRL